MPKDDGGTMIVKEGPWWVLRSKDGRKVLGRHRTKEAAMEQERVVMAAKQRAPGKGVMGKTG